MTHLATANRSAGSGRFVDADRRRSDARMAAARFGHAPGATIISVMRIAQGSFPGSRRALTTTPATFSIPMPDSSRPESRPGTARKVGRYLGRELLGRSVACAVMVALSALSPGTQENECR